MRPGSSPGWGKEYKMDKRYYMIRWLSQWGDIIDALCGIVTLGFWTPKFGIKVRKEYYRGRLRKALRKKKKAQSN